MDRTDNNVPQIDGTWDDDDDNPIVKIGQLDGSTDDEQIVVVDDDEDELLPAPPSSNIKQEAVIPAAVSRTTVAAVPVPSCDSLSSSCSSRGPTPGPARTPITPMMDLECDIPGNIVTTATLCSSCGNTFPNKKSYDGHLDQCPASRLSETAGTGTPDSDMSPRKDFSILGLLKQEDMKTEAPEDRSEEDIVIISETISKAPPPPAAARRTTGMHPPAVPRQRPTYNPPLPAAAAYNQPQPAGPPLATYNQPLPAGGQQPFNNQPPPTATYLNPYGGAVIQYPYSPYPLQTGYLTPAPMGYITVPPVIQQPIYYNSILPPPPVTSYPSYTQPAPPQPSAFPTTTTTSQPPTFPSHAAKSQPSASFSSSVSTSQSTSSSSVQPPPRKVARVQPTPYIVSPIPTKAKASPNSSTAPPPKLSPISSLSSVTTDPMAALSTLSKNPLPSTTTSLDLPTDLSTTNRQLEIQAYHQTQTIYQSKTLKQEIPTNWRSKSPKHEVIDVESRSSTPNSQWGDHQYCSSPEPEPQLSSKARASLNGINITTKASKTNSIQFVFERNERENNYNIKEVTVKDGTKSKSNINPKDANKVLKIKAKKSRVKKIQN